MATIPTWQRVKIKYRDTAKRNFGYEIKDKEDSIWINPTKFTSPIKRTKALLAALWRLIPAKLQQDSPAITGGTMMRGGDAHFYAFQAIKALTPKQFIQALQSQNPKKQQQLARALSALELLITPDSPQLPPLKKKQQPQPQPSQQPLPTERPPKPILKLPSLPQLQPAPDISAIDEKTNYAKYEESEGEDEEPEPPAPQPPQLTPEATADFDELATLLLSGEEALQHTGVLPEHAQAIAKIMSKENRIYGLMPVNKLASLWLKKKYPTKPLSVQIKSSETTLAGGLVALNPFLTKEGAQFAQALQLLIEENFLEKETITQIKSGQITQEIIYKILSSLAKEISKSSEEDNEMKIKKFIAKKKLTETYTNIQKALDQRGMKTEQLVLPKQDVENNFIKRMKILVQSNQSGRYPTQYTYMLEEKDGAMDYPWNQYQYLLIPQKNGYQVQYRMKKAIITREEEDWQPLQVLTSKGIPLTSDYDPYIDLGLQQQGIAGDRRIKLTKEQQQEVAGLASPQQRLWKLAQYLAGHAQYQAVRRTSTFRGVITAHDERLSDRINTAVGHTVIQHGIAQNKPGEAPSHDNDKLIFLPTGKYVLIRNKRDLLALLWLAHKHNYYDGILSRHYDDTIHRSSAKHLAYLSLKGPIPLTKVAEIFEEQLMPDVYEFLTKALPWIKVTIDDTIPNGGFVLKTEKGITLTLKPNGDLDTFLHENAHILISILKHHRDQTLIQTATDAELTQWATAVGWETLVGAGLVSARPSIGTDSTIRSHPEFAKAKPQVTPKLSAKEEEESLGALRHHLQDPANWQTLHTIISQIPTKRRIQILNNAPVGEGLVSARPSIGLVRRRWRFGLGVGLGGVLGC